MRTLRFLLIGLFVFALVEPLPAQSKDSSAASSRRGKKKGKGDSPFGFDDATQALIDGKKYSFKKEMEALDEAAKMLEPVNDAKAAEKVAKKLITMFSKLPPPLSGTDDEIERWSVAQNKVSAEMERLSKMTYFKESGLQEAWTTIADPQSRSRSQRRR